MVKARRWGRQRLQDTFQMPERIGHVFRAITELHFIWKGSFCLPHAFQYINIMDSMILKVLSNLNNAIFMSTQRAAVRH